MSLRGLLIYVCFFVSGASALIYEIVWQRMLTLVFGMSTFSVAAVVAAFLAGLAAGARLFGRRADRSGNPLRLYLGIELAIAAAGLATGFIVPPLMRLFGLIHAAAEPGWLLSNVIRFGLAFVAFGVPSILIGATVPVMARLTAPAARSVAVGFGRFYAVNTLGSVAGAALAGFILIRTIGVQNTLYFAVLGNAATALIILAASRLRGPLEADVGPTIESVAGQDETLHTRFALVVATVAGAVGLAYEIAWIRLLAVFTFNSVYVFTMVVTVYLAALAIGSAIAARLMRWQRVHRLRAFVAVQMLLALTVPVVLAGAPAAATFDITDPALSASRAFLVEYGLALAIVFVPTVLIGLTLPLLVGLFAGSLAGAGRDVGRIYAWNATGTILGAAATGVLLIPLFGLRGTLLSLAAVNFFLAAYAAALDSSPRPLWRAIAPFGAACFVLLVAVLPPATRFFRPGRFSDETVLYYAEGPSATVHVSETSGDDERFRVLYVDSKSVAGTYDEIVTDQKMLAHLPLLLHPSPDRALTVGFGTGGTSYSMLQHQVRVDCVEIEPRVADAWRFFESENRGIVGPQHERTNFHLILDDARAWLHVAPDKYDVIVTDVTSIQYRGSGNLYTTDYFDLMRANLNSTGLGAAWVPISGITPEQLKILVRSFRSVYPHTSAWYMINLPTDFAILVGTPERLTIRLDAIAKRMARPLVKKDLAPIGMDNPYKLAACLLLAEEDVEAYVGDGPLHTDDRPVLDYLTHASSYRNTLAANLTAMLAHRSNAAEYVTDWPDAAVDARAAWQTWYDASQHLMRGHALLHGPGPYRAERALEEYRRAASLTPQDATTQELVTNLQATP